LHTQKISFHFLHTTRLFKLISLPPNKIIFPRPFAFAIDDMGWNNGSSVSINGSPGPFRCGLKRTFDLNDYKYIVAVGKKVGARILGLFILSEMDRGNVLAKYPTTTHQGIDWDNSKRVNTAQLEIMQFVSKESAHLEFGLHGTGHEYWDGSGIQKRAEWYNMVDRQPWPESIMREHISGFKEIMAQYQLSPEYGHSFPESFVACANSYYWNPGGKYSIGKLMSEAGVKYANTDFTQIPELLPPQEINGGGFDNGTHVISRMCCGVSWYALDCLPTVPILKQASDIAETHWPNWLAQDDFMQEEVTQKWIGYYQKVQQLDSRYIAKNTEQLHSQWLYKKYSIITETIAGYVEIDNTQMPEEPYQFDMLGNLVLKIKLKAGEHLSAATINNDLIPGYFEEFGFAFLYLPRLQREKYLLQYTIGSCVMPLYVLHDCTSNIYSLKQQGNMVVLSVKIYGRQTIKIKCGKPANVTVSSLALSMQAVTFNSQSGMLFLLVEALDMQGNKGEIQIMY